MKDLQLLLLLIWLPFCVLKVVTRNETLNYSYCDISPCYSENLACNNDGKIKNCLKTAAILTPNDFKAPIMHAFNLFRNNVAGGKWFRNLPQAAHMARMSWDEELAYFAELDVSRCIVWPRPCMASKNFYSLGGLAAFYTYIANNESSQLDAILSIAKEWMQSANAISKHETLKLPERYHNQLYFATTQLLIEHNSKFGCAALSYSTTFDNNVILSCVFCADNQPGKRLYKWGLRPGVGCKRQDSRYKFLCAVGEQYNYDKQRRPLDVIKMGSIW